MYTISKKMVLNSTGDGYEVMVIYYNYEMRVIRVKTYNVHSASMRRFFKLSGHWQISGIFTTKRLDYSLAKYFAYVSKLNENMIL